MSDYRCKGLKALPQLYNQKEHTMKTVLIHTMYTVLLASLLYMNIVQARTITNQQHTIREMITNPYCLIPEVK